LVLSYEQGIKKNQKPFQSQKLEGLAKKKPVEQSLQIAHLGK